MLFIRALLLAVAIFCVLASTATAQSTRFGEMFPDLPDFTAPTNQQLADLAQTQLDPNADSRTTAWSRHRPSQGCVFTGFTYFGQFIDHDLTLDLSPSPPRRSTSRRSPTSARSRSTSTRCTAAGPTVSPQLYDGNRFRMQEPNPNGVRDLPRNPDGSAILVEKRNDENQVLSQVHVAMLKAHNRLVDEGYTFGRARSTLQHHYQAAVVR